MIRQITALLFRALRTDARSFPPHLLRLGLLLCMLFALFTTYEQRNWSNSPGLFFFTWLASLNMAFVTVSGMAYFSTCITEEKEAGTLALLKMANVGPGTFILGKWLPQLWGLGLLIAIQIPFAMLGITLGGLTWDQVIATFCLLFTHLLFMGSMGLLISVIRHTSNEASATALMVFLGILFGPWLLYKILSGWLSPSNFFVEALGYFPSATGFWRLISILNNTQSIPDWLGYQGRASLVISAVLIAISWVGFEHWTSKEPVTGKRRWGWKRNKAGRATKPLTHSRPWSHPLIWKEFTYLTGGWPWFILKLVGYPLVIVGVLVLLVMALGLPGNAWDELRGVAMAFSLVFLSVELLVLAPKLYRTELVEQTWSTLAMLPRGLAGIAYPRIAAAALSLLPGLSWGSFFTICCIDQWSRGGFREDEFAGCLYCLSLVPLTFHLITLLSVVLTRLPWPATMFLGGGMVLMGNIMFIVCVETMRIHNGTEFAVIMLLMTGISMFLTVFMHALIAIRLHHAAAEA